MMPAPSPFSDVRCDTIALPGGALEVRCTTALAPHPETLVELLQARAATQPDHTLFAEPAADGSVRTISYAAALQRARGIARGLLAGAGAGTGEKRQPVVLLSANGIDAALVILGAYLAGVPVAPVSAAYSTMSSDHQKLRYIVGLLAPSFIFFDDGAAHAPAAQALAGCGAQFVAFARPAAGMRTLAEVIGQGERQAPAALPAIDPDAPAKILFTSGSTGSPKGVVNTQRMMVANQQALAQIWPVLSARPLQLVDWLPWNHTFGGNQNFNMALFHGGTLVIDRGQPTTEGIARTAETLKRFAPTVYFNVPRGFDVLTGLMARDEALRHALFGTAELLGYAGASLPRPVWDALKAMSREVKGREIPVVGLWGSTETGPVVTAVYFPSDHPGNIGLPIPGARLRLVPDGSGKQEMRVSAPSVTPGYWKLPDKTRELFDEEGFIRMGDAGRFADPERLQAGIMFDGRLSENFKLTSGTWVNVGELRVALISACPALIADVVIAGHDRDALAALVFPKLPACQALAGDAAADAAAALRSTAVREAIAQALATHNRAARGSSQKVVRALLLDAPPSVDAGEITDKGYINQRAVLARRDALVQALYAPEAGADVIVVPA